MARKPGAVVTGSLTYGCATRRGTPPWRGSLALLRHPTRYSSMARKPGSSRRMSGSSVLVMSRVCVAWLGGGG
eukprot:scaffold36560_cov44-Phaeocystis_antarctica.AAC.1